MFTALGAEAFDDKRNGMREIALGQMDRWNGRVLKAKRLLAGLAIEMEMPLRMVALALVVVTEFVVQYPTPVLKRMHHIAVGKQRQHTENTRLIQIEHLLLHVPQTHRTRQSHQRLIDQNAIDSRLHRLLF